MGCGIDIMEKEIDSGKSNAFENRVSNFCTLAPFQSKQRNEDTGCSKCRIRTKLLGNCFFFK